MSSAPATIPAHSSRLAWLDLATDPDTLSIRMSIASQFSWRRDVNTPVPVLKVDTQVERSQHFGGPEYWAVSQLMKEVFHDDTATPFGTEKFAWDKVELPDTSERDLWRGFSWPDLSDAEDALLTAILSQTPASNSRSGSPSLPSSFLTGNQDSVPPSNIPGPMTNLPVMPVSCPVTLTTCEEERRQQQRRQRALRDALWAIAYRDDSETNVASASHDVPLAAPPPSLASSDLGINGGTGVPDASATPGTPSTGSSESSVTLSPPPYSSDVREPAEEDPHGHLLPVLFLPPQSLCYVMAGGIICGYFDRGTYHSITPNY